jgi:hypothetical protein
MFKLLLLIREKQFSKLPDAYAPFVDASQPGFFVKPKAWRAEDGKSHLAFVLSGLKGSDLAKFRKLAEGTGNVLNLGTDAEPLDPVVVLAEHGLEIFEE